MIRSPTCNSHVDRAIAYAEDVVAGRIVTGRLARLSCERFLRDLDAADAGTSPWEFRRDLAERPCKLAELLSNIKGPLAGMPLRLMPWQSYFYCAVFGFVARGTTIRRFQQASVWVPRGNGKSTVVAPLALFSAFVEGEGGAEVYAAAVTRDQAKIVWDAARDMAQRSPQFRRKFGIDVGAHALTQAASASSFKSISSDAKALDGLNVHLAVLDEIGSHKSSAVYDVVRTAMGKRLQPLLITISTATADNAGIGKQLWDYGQKIVEQEVEDDRFFALHYCADEDDDPWLESTWIKANPSWGVAVQADGLRSIFKQAKNSPAREAAVFTRHLNRWVGADNAYFSVTTWRSRGDPSLRLEDFLGRDCHLALDLASRTDLAALSIVFPETQPDGSLTYTAFSRAYINRQAHDESRIASYADWSRRDMLTVTEGNETDFAVIEDEILDLCREHNVLSVAFDPWQGAYISQRLATNNVPVIEFRMNTMSLSPATLELDAAIRSGRIAHDGNAVLTWCLGNVVGHLDARDNVYPKRAKSKPEAKIDAAMALIMAIGRCVADPPEKPVVSPYASRGLLVI